MNAWFLLLLLLTIQINVAMEKPLYPTPGELIGKHINDPTLVIQELKKYSQKQLQTYRSFKCNNLLHVTVDHLGQNQKEENIKQLMNDYKPILSWLVSLGLDINDVNDDHHTPLTMAYNADEKGEMLPLVHFLENELGAHATYVSIAPELRICKQIIRDILTCNYCKKPKYS